MQDKFNMSVEENVFYAKRNIVDYIWKIDTMQSKMKGKGTLHAWKKRLW